MWLTHPVNSATFSKYVAPPIGASKCERGARFELEQGREEGREEGGRKEEEEEGGGRGRQATNKTRTHQGSGGEKV